MADIIDKIIGPLKAAGDTAEKLLKLYAVVEYGDDLRKLHQDVVTGLVAARDAQIELTAKQEEIEALKREVRALKTQAAQLEQYEFRELPPGVFVMALKDVEQRPASQPYACERCFGEGKIRPLHKLPGMHNGLETIVCNTCGAELKIGHYQPPQPVRVQRPLRRR